MSEDKFTRLYKYIQSGFKKIDGHFDTLTNVVDTYAKQTETYMQEMLALAHRVDRLEQWILKIAEATGVKLAYE